MFLDFANFYQQFVRYYARITRALTKFLKSSKQRKQNNSFVFNKKVIIIFINFIIVFTQAFILTHFDFRNYIRIKTNIFKFIIVAILS